MRVALALCGLLMLTDVTATGELKFEMYTGPERALGPNSVLVTGAHDALLIDAQFLNGDAQKLVELIKATGKNLTTVLITHAHPDHYFGLGVIRAAFPQATVLAREPVRRIIGNEFPAKRVHWQELYAGEIPMAMTAPEALVGDTLNFDGHAIKIVDLGICETVDATAFYFLLIYSSALLRRGRKKLPSIH